MDIMTAAIYAFDHLYHEDKANAAVHVSQVKFSPIVFRLAEALKKEGLTSRNIEEVMADRGKYEEDTGR